jgi:alkylation response protein AidB-like acyl-CoA dehydrogenase
MDLNLTEDQRLIVDMVRDFANKELAPNAAHLDETGEFPSTAIRKMAELGLSGMNVPESAGGAETGPIAYALALMEIARGDGSVCVTTSVTNFVSEMIYLAGTEEQRRAFLPKILQGDYPTGAFALTENSSGSDASALKATAILDGDEYVINGSKQFITSGEYASVVVVLARTSNDSKAGGISAFLVERGTPGMIVGKEEQKMGLKGSNTVELQFENCRVPAANMLGGLGEGFKVAMRALDSGRIGVASQACGIAQAALEASVAYAKEREQFGKPLSKMQAIQFKLADMKTQLEAAKLLTLQAASLKQHRKPFTKQASMAKLYASEAVNRICWEAIQIHGGYGYVKEYPVERYYRDCRVTTIYEGTSEVQRMVIARSVCA